MTTTSGANRAEKVLIESPKTRLNTRVLGKFGFLSQAKFYKLQAINF